MPEADVRETFESGEEALRVALVAHQRATVATLRVKVAQDSTDGHTAVLQPVTQMNVIDMDGNVTPTDLPQLQDAPIHFTGGGLMVATHAIKMGDEGTATFTTMPMDTWHQTGQDTSQQIDARTHSLSDACYHPGGRSDPNMLQQVDPDSHQIRSVDKKIVHENHPTNGTTIRHVDPSTQEASQGFDPFTQATKFFDHMINPTSGHTATATDSGNVNSHSLDHDNGWKASAANGNHTITAHPQNGTGVTSTVAHTIQAPNASLDAQGNLSNQGTHTSQGAIKSATSMTAPSGNFASGSIGGMSLSGGVLGALGSTLAMVLGNSGSGGDTPSSVSADTVSAGRYIYTPSYSVAELLALTDMRPGAHAHVTDFLSLAPAFYAPISESSGGGSTVVPVFYPSTALGWVVG